MPLIMLPDVMRAPSAVTLLAFVALIAAGCGGGPARESPSVDGIAETIADLEEALSERDLGRICDRIFSPEARLRAGGEECPRRLARTTRAVERPRLELVSVTLGRDSAIARVRASAGDEPPALDSMRFVAVEGAYRVDSLSSG
jgi:hypothetical protein